MCIWGEGVSFPPKRVQLWPTGSGEPFLVAKNQRSPCLAVPSVCSILFTHGLQLFFGLFAELVLDFPGVHLGVHDHAELLPHPSDPVWKKGKNGSGEKNKSRVDFLADDSLPN